VHVRKYDKQVVSLPIGLLFARHARAFFFFVVYKARPGHLESLEMLSTNGLREYYSMEKVYFRSLNFHESLIFIPKL